jgi:hypothetical protein
VTTNKPLEFTVKLVAPNGQAVHEGGDKVDIKITSTSSGTPPRPLHEFLSFLVNNE